MVNEDKLNEIEDILEKGNVWAIDLLPKRCDNTKLIREFDVICHKRNEIKDYIRRISNIYKRLAPYYDTSIWLGENSRIGLRKYANKIIGKDVDLAEKLHFVKKALKKEQTLSILLEPINAVLIMGVYNSALYSVNNDDIGFITKIVECEGLFMWQSTE